MSIKLDKNIIRQALIGKVPSELKGAEEEIKELKSLCLWSIRRLHQTYKDFAYDEYEKITGDSPERL
ncbi:hypothetical protein PJ311_19030 [Bacillus sp. CLL-7-23]|uniref:Uncharacterized protein n=1 Tax=Bacillus changyiensis TaxID=3004103 RepID=A0ABT4X8L3_9BACI|nr:hypothetical protein [Bacillus changyiensis]MDA1477288.1 hypothetical protein [Bacillus changyiensis]MDA7028629.1 hypothetical protein [Bacillus changyiensis]